MMEHAWTLNINGKPAAYGVGCMDKLPAFPSSQKKGALSNSSLSTIGAIPRAAVGAWNTK
jgi:hypothetical protein